MKGTPLFGWFKQRPEIGEQFANMMTAWSFGRPQWMDPHFYPTTERLVDGAKQGTMQSLKASSFQTCRED